MSTVIKVENLSKQYRLGTIGTGTLSHDINRWWHKVTGKEDPYLKIGQINDRTQKGGTEDYVWALKDISFEVKAGEVLGVIGRNGAGKSTLLKILSRTTLPTTGSAKIKGRIASLLEVGTGFHPELTGRENIFLNGAILGMRKAEIKSKFDEIVDFSGVDKYVDTPVKRYSSGMYVRLAFAVAAHLDPEILIVDEVLAVGDLEFQKKCLGKMKDVSDKEGRTVLYVTHNMPTVLNLCQRCILLENGTIKKIGMPSNVISNYLQKDRSVNNSNEIIIEASSPIAKKALPYFVLHKFWFGNTFRNSDNVIDANENIILELIIDGEVVHGDNRFNIGFVLKNELGDTIIISYCTDQHESEWIKFENGKISIKTKLDTSFLNEGKYQVSLLASLHCVEMFFIEEDQITLSFEIIGNRGLSPYWINKRNSILAPYISWKENI